MLWVIHCVAGPNAAAAREPVRHAHKVYLDQKLNEGALVLTGTALAHDGKTRTGSVYIVNLGSAAEARAFYEGEPFAKAGVYESVTITGVKKSRWNPEAAEGAEGRGDRPARS
jgi:uncharacterized protein YciI